MKPHPDFAETLLPRETDLGDFRLTPLAPPWTEEDFAAVTGSENVLLGVFGGDWPKGLTLEDNRIDLAWHDREFTARRSFAWIIRDGAGAYIGCAYLYPDIGATGSGTVVTWMCDTPDRLDRLSHFNRDLRVWITEFLPNGYRLGWVSNDR